MIASLVLPACPKSTRRTLVPDVPTNGDAEARSRFQEAQRHFERDGNGDSAETFEAIAEEFPDDPIAPFALLYAGISAVEAGEYTKAIDNLTKLDAADALDDGIRIRANLFRGLAHNYRGDHADALPFLQRGEPGIENDDEKLEWLAAMSVAVSHGPTPLAAGVYFDQWFARATAAEQAYIVARLTEIVAAAAPDAAKLALDGLSNRKGPSAAVLGARVSTDLVAAGDSEAAEKILADTAEARALIGVAAADPADTSHVNPRRIGAVIALTGEYTARGTLANRGLAVAAGVFGNGKRTRATVSVRDSESTPDGAASAVDALIAEGVIGIVGPIDGKSADAAAGRAIEAGVPFISLNGRASKRAYADSPFVFHVVHSPEDRARSLARYAHGAGIRDFAILAPDNGYGHAVARAFRDEVESLGGDIVIEVEYNPKSTSFGTYVEKIEKKPWRAVFIPDQARRLELIAPALAAEDLVSRPVKGKKPRNGRKIVLLSTAEFVNPDYLQSSGRYSWGAVFAPGFYADLFDERIGDFVQRYELAYEELPTALDAYAHDAALVFRDLVAAGHTTRAGVAAALASEKVVGLTGKVSFGANKGRSDDGLLYVVRQEDGDYVIRAMR